MKIDKFIFYWLSRNIKSFKFYCPGRQNRIFETNKATFDDEEFNRDESVIAENVDVSEFKNIQDWFTFPELNVSLQNSGEEAEVLQEQNIEN